MPPSTSTELTSAHRAFAVFYANAVADDANLMDALVIARGSLRACISVPREELSASIRRPFEQTSAGIECFFAALREAVRNTRTLQALSQKDRELIEHELFEVNAPVWD